MTPGSGNGTGGASHGGAAPPRLYEGGAFHPDFPNGRAMGNIFVGPAVVLFSGKAGQLEMPLAGLDITVGGASDRILFFKHPSLPGSTLHTSDHEILKEAALRERPELLAQIVRVKNRKSKNSVILLTVLLLVVAIIVGMVAATGPVAVMVADRIPPEAEATLGDHAFEQVKPTLNLIEDDGLKRQLETLARPLVREATNAGPFSFRFHISNDETLNAAAFPGGHIVVHSGLILGAKSPEELAAVLAHEIAHVQMRHSLRSIVKSAGTWMVFSMFLGDFQESMGLLTEGGQQLLNMHYSRDQEREADEVGWDLLVAAGHDPRGAITFFGKLLEEEQKRGIQGDSYWNSHPGTDQRIARMKEKAGALPAGKQYRGFDLNFLEFQNSLRAKLEAGKKGVTKAAGKEEK